MQVVSRSALAVLAAGVVLLFGAGGIRPHDGARAQVAKDMPRVVMFDSNASFTPGNEYLGGWTFAPSHITLHQGEQIEFDNPVGNSFPHTVTSITWTGMAPARTLASGTAFNSSPTRDTYIMPGGSWVLDTATLDPGQYLYYCAIHPWMVGTFTLEPPE